MTATIEEPKAWSFWARCKHDPRFEPGHPIQPGMFDECSNCPVRWECLWEELRLMDPTATYGMRGGFGPRKRIDAHRAAGGDPRVALTDLYMAATR